MLVNEYLGDDVGELIPHEGRSGLVVLGPPFRVREDGVGLAEALVFLFGLRVVLIDIRMKILRKPPVSLANFRLVGIAGNAEGFVMILRHNLSDHLRN
jgi:hypothetical protein